MSKIAEQPQEPDYRASHMGLGPEYHAAFTENPRRAMIWALEQRILSDIVKRYLIPEETDHLDFACGTGRILGYFQGRVRSSTGVDVSTSMLRVARGVASQARIIEADITHDDVLAGQKFDLITAFRFFPNAEPGLRREAIETLFSKLRTGGHLVLNNHQNYSCLGYRARRFLTRAEFNCTPAHEITDLVASVGLRIEKVYHVGVVPEFESRMIRPRFLVEWVESMVMHLPTASLAQNLIYVCSKVSHALRVCPEIRHCFS